MGITLAPRVKRFLRYLSVGVGTFLLDLSLLYCATSLLGIPYYLATPCSFLIAISLNYLLSRRLVFKGTARSLHQGYVNFALIGIGGAAATTGLVFLLVHYVGLYYLVARVAVAGVIGIGNYFMNLYLNFKVVGDHSH
jgi:putative flippase GtrA